MHLASSGHWICCKTLVFLVAKNKNILRTFQLQILPKTVRTFCSNSQSWRSSLVQLAQILGVPLILRKFLSSLPSLSTNVLSGAHAWSYLTHEKSHNKNLINSPESPLVPISHLTCRFLLLLLVDFRSSTILSVFGTKATPLI